MIKLILEILLLVILLGGVVIVLNHVIFFWINKRRLWKKEDAEFNKLKQQEALQELTKMNELLNTSEIQELKTVKKGSRIHI